MQGNGLEKIEALLGSDRFQVIVQMGRELLVNNKELAKTFANSFLPQSGHHLRRGDSGGSDVLGLVLG